jgi:hypothetical protein
MIEEVLYFIITTFGLSMIISTEKIFKSFRKKIKNKFLYNLISCPNCLSVWIGFILSFLFPTLIMIYLSNLIYMMISYTSVRLILAWLSNKEFVINE